MTIYDDYIYWQEKNKTIKTQYDGEITTPADLSVIFETLRCFNDYMKARPFCGGDVYDSLSCQDDKPFLDKLNKLFESHEFEPVKVIYKENFINQHTIDWIYDDEES